MNDEKIYSEVRPLRLAEAPDTPPARVRAALRSPFTWMALLITYVLFSRLWGLSAKVMHHDESLFAYYGYWLFRGNGYDYQPILHGPVLQWLSAFFFFLFGDDQWTMRIPSMLGGLLMFPVAWCWRRYLGGAAGAVAVTGLIALSPSIAFYARFLRNDVPYLTATMWTALCLVRAMQTARPKYVWGAILGATLMFCMMESSIFFFAACIGYLTTMLLADLIIWRNRKQEDEKTWPRWLRDETRRWSGSWPDTRKTLRPSDYLYCALVALTITAAAGWLFHRIFYATLHIYTPIQVLLAKAGLDVTPRAANWMIAFVILVTAYLLSLLVLSNIRRPRGRYGIAGWFSRVVWLNRWHAVAAIAVAVIIYTAIFTTLFTNTKAVSFDHQLRDFKGPEMALTPVQIYKNTWDYWWDQHKLHRIKGPFHYYLPILLLYELPIIGLALLGWLRALKNTRRPWLHSALLLAMHALLGLLIWVIPPIDWEKMDKLFHLTHPLHLFLIMFYAQLLVYISPMLFRQGRRAESFITYWGVTSLFAYSYAGEKVPWLTVHTVGPLALLAGTELVRLASSCAAFVRDKQSQKASATSLRRTVFLIIACAAVLYQVRNNHLLLFVHPWSPAERLVYNHTSPDINEAAAMIDNIAQTTNFGNKLPVLMQGEMGWPLHWYLRDYNNIIAPVGESAENTTRPVVMVDWQMAGVPNLRDNYSIRRMKVREWWEPEMLDISAMADLYLLLTPLESRDTGINADRYKLARQEWAKLWRYLAYREIWIDPANSGWSNGANEFAFCVRNDIDERLMTYEWLAVTPKRPDIPAFVPY